jgi:signal transduction histidine kinase
LNWIFISGRPSATASATDALSENGASQLNPTETLMKATGLGETLFISPFTADDQTFRHNLPRYFATTVAVSTIIALLVCLPLHSWRAVLPVQLIANCTGLSILVLLSLARLTFMRRLQAGGSWRRSIYVALVALGALAGNRFGESLTHRVSRPSSWHDAITAIVFALLGAVAAIAVNAALAERTQRKRDLERAERAAIEAQLRVLQAQIEPHFLFNSLANLDALIATAPGQARQLLANLIRYLRAALTHARSEKATLQTEVEQLKAYLAIMALRLPNRLTTEFDCDPDCLRLVFPAMLLQPLVENAITHGIEPAGDGGTVRVTVRCSREMLLISVDDTGVGLGSSRTAGTGAGIRNIRARLNSLFGESAQLTLEARRPRGTHAGIEIPLRSLSEST